MLVTGASGFTGSLLVKKLLAAGANVRAIARASSDLSPLANLPITWIRGAVYNPETVLAGAENVDYIFHVAAAYRATNIPHVEYSRVHIESTKLLAEAALKNPNFKCLVHVSTVGVHGHIEKPPGDENSPFGPGDEYQRTKLLAEQWLHGFAAEHKLPYTVIRPAAIYGPGDKRLFKVFRMAAKPVFPILGYGQCLYHFIHVEDLTDAMMLAAQSPQAIGEAFIVGADEPIRLEDTARIISGVLGRKLRVLRIPAWPFFMLGYICEAICKPFGIQPPIYPRRVAFFTKDRAFNTAKLRNVLGYKIKYDNRRGLEETTRWYMENGWLK